MTKKYTAADFANARFAELGKYGIRAHKSAGDSYWQRDGIKRATNEEMADAGWVPVPTKQQLTERDYADYVDDLGLGELTLEEILADFGIEIIPDPELTNAERLTEMHKDWSCLANPESETFPEYLDRQGVTAPTVKGN